MPRFVLALVAFAALLWPAVAHARRAPAGDGKRTVKIETTPVGASVYLGDKEGGPEGVTPLELRLAPGEYILVIELEGYLDETRQVTVEPATGRRAREVIEVDPILMRSAVSTLDVKGEAPPGALVLVDGEERGELPLQLEIAPGPHQVQVVAGGRTIFEEWVELDGGQEHVVTVSPAAPIELPDETPRGPRPPIAIARGGIEVGTRAFTYDGAQSGGNAVDFSASSLVMYWFQAELAPWRLAEKARVAWPLVLVVGGGYSPAAEFTDGAGDSADQFWRTSEVGLRYRLAIGSRAVLGFDAGWSRLLYTFRGELREQLPDVDYQNVRLGLRGEVKLAPAVAWVGIENRVVASGGDLPGRFRSADTDGFAVRVGALARFWRDRLEGGVEYQLSRYSWVFTYEAMDEYRASGGTDRFDGFRFWVGGAY